MKKATLLTLVIMLAAAVAGAAEAPQSGKAAVEPAVKEIGTSIVRIMGPAAGVEPLNLFIEPGTVVVWLNQYNGQVRVTFPQKQVTVACKSPVNFEVSEQGSYVSKPVDVGAVASLCFVERGTFNYYIERMPMSRMSTRDEGFRFEGKIVVK